MPQAAARSKAPSSLPRRRAIFGFGSMRCSCRATLRFACAQALSCSAGGAGRGPRRETGLAGRDAGAGEVGGRVGGNLHVGIGPSRIRSGYKCSFLKKKKSVRT